METSTAAGSEPIADALRGALQDAFAIAVDRAERIHSGTASDNFRITARDGGRWFAKVHRSAGAAAAAARAVELTEFAGRGGTPVPGLRRSVDRAVVARSHGLLLSVWELIDGETAETGLSGRRWHTVGAVLGRLHRHLASHPSGPPASADPVRLLDLDAAAAAYDALVERYRRPAAAAGGFGRWALDALGQRRALLPAVRAVLQRLPPLTEQVLHGDLAAPNVLLRGDDVAAVIDFQPPTRGFLAWEIARIAGDPRTLAVPRWRTELPGLLDSYRAAHPTVPSADLDGVLAVGAAYTLASTYPLSVLVDRRGRADHALQTYARQRHAAALAMFEACS
ncbi:aminoglycoside phosphotransferase [Desertihabitans brevis]|uniref:Aminoglycoside phosphotransferase n=1 Tax=Desertihabitans brevis TaxID=2268447 RepID=A0A367YYV1_9ACTN|nr:phosphotransferase [Desertihabitans brevis]RCK71095.1 aminoglycoside phosphotransferase [Desertihabitans brevis]